MTKEISVKGVIVTVSMPYEAGHQITEAEAKALNQVRLENIRNNARKQVEEILEKAEDTDAAADAIQAAISERDETYEFSLSSTSGAKVDPLTKMALSIARQTVTAKIKEEGMTVKEYKEKNGEEAVNELVETVSQYEKVIEVAKKRLAERDEIADLANL